MSTQIMFQGNVFIHHVFFWLKDGSGEDARQQLIGGLTKLSSVKTIKSFYIGAPAYTARDVVDNTYSVSWLLLFNNKEDQNSYQVDPDHLEFIDKCSHLWDRVVVYDTINV